MVLLFLFRIVQEHFNGEMFLLVWRNMLNKWIQSDMVTKELIIIVFYKCVQFQRASDSILICVKLSQSQYQQMKK